MDVEDDGLALILNWQDLLVIISEIRDYGLPFEKTIKECNKKALFSSCPNSRLNPTSVKGLMNRLLRLYVSYQP